MAESPGATGSDDEPGKDIESIDGASSAASGTGSPKRQPGRLKGKIWMADDFETWPDWFLDAMEAPVVSDEPNPSEKDGSR